GCGEGEDAAALGEKERARWREQALAWLRADVAAWTKRLADPRTPARAAAQQLLRHWQHDPALAGLRDADSLAKLPEAQREAWRRLWADLEAVLKQARRQDKARG